MVKRPVSCASNPRSDPVTLSALCDALATGRATLHGLVGELPNLGIAVLLEPRIRVQRSYSATMRARGRRWKFAVRGWHLRVS